MPAYCQIDFGNATRIREEAYEVVRARPEAARKVGTLVGGREVTTPYADPVWRIRVRIGPLTPSESDALRTHVGARVSVSFIDTDRPGSRFPDAELWQNATFGADLIDAKPKAVGADITRGDRWELELQALESAFQAPAPLDTVTDRPSIYPVPDFTVGRGQVVNLPFGIYSPSNAPYSVEVSGLPPGLAWDEADEAVRGVVDPGAALRGYRVVVTVRVSATSFASRVFTITVQNVPVVWHLSPDFGGVAVLPMLRLRAGYVRDVPASDFGDAAVAADLTIDADWHLFPDFGDVSVDPSLRMRAGYVRDVSPDFGAVAVAAEMEVAPDFEPRPDFGAVSLSADLLLGADPSLLVDDFGAVSLSADLSLGADPSLLVDFGAVEVDADLAIEARNE